jgi:hypothetical protein
LPFFNKWSIRKAIVTHNQQESVMSTKICLLINDDGTMSVKAGEAMEQPMPGMEGGQEEGNTVPVKNIDEALAMIKQLAEAAAMPAEGEAIEQPMQDQGEESAMMGAYRPGQTGR